MMSDEELATAMTTLASFSEHTRSSTAQAKRAVCQYIVALTAQRDNARNIAVALEQELAEATRRRSIGGTPPEYTHNVGESE